MLYIIPTRGRPANMLAQLRAWSETYSGVAQALYVVDSDDPLKDIYHESYEAFGPTFASLIIGERRRVNPTVNLYAGIHAQTDNLIGFMGDDHLPRTAAWDSELAAELERVGWGVAYGNDLFQRRNIPTAVVMTSNIINALGYMSPPGLTHLFMDNAWRLIGESTQLIYRDDVIIEHMHPQAQKSEWDAGYVEVNSGEMWKHDETEYERWKAEDWPMDRLKLRAAMTP